MNLDLAALVSGQLFAFLLLFARIGAMIMMMPGIGEPFVNTRARLVVALAICLLLLPILGSSLPPQPNNVLGVVLLIIGEVTVGLFVGMLTRVLLSALETAGFLIAMQISLSNASMFNPAVATQSTLPAALLGAAAIVLLFASDLHHLLLRSFVDSYQVFTAGAMPPLADFTTVMTGMVAKSFLLGTQLAAPFLILGILLYVPAGLMAKLMPSLPIFFLALPIQILFGMALMAVTIPGLLLFWLTEFGTSMQGVMASQP